MGPCGLQALWVYYSTMEKKMETTVRGYIRDIRGLPISGFRVLVLRGLGLRL